ncbi:MAG: hypothetical protein KAQ68_11180 [Clostridiales bacterium]|nr:hypothetical protein [Clostridiales bacterium]
MLFNTKYSVVDFGTSKVSIAIGVDGDEYADILGIGICEYAGFRDNEWLVPNDLQESILLAKRDVEKRTGKKVVHVYVIIPGEFTRTFFSHLTTKPINLDGRITSDDIDKMIKEGRQDLPWPDDYDMIHTDPVLYLLDGQSWKKRPEEQYAKDLECFVSYTAADRVFMENMSYILDDLGMGIKGFIAAPKVVGDLVYQSCEKKTVVIIDSGYYSTDISIYENGGLILHDNIPIGGYHIASDIMIKMNADRDTAELVKRNCSIGMDNIGINKILLDENENRISVPLDDTQMVVENRVDEVINSVMEQTNKTGMVLDNRTAVFITGGGISTIKGIREFITRRLGVTVKIFKPLRPVIATSMQTSVCAGLEYVIRNKGILNGNKSKKKGMNYYK